jgi:hypothetical protein
MPASLHACGAVFFPSLISNSICRSSVTICSGEYFVTGMTVVLSGECCLISPDRKIPVNKASRYSRSKQLLLLEWTSSTSNVRYMSEIKPDVGRSGVARCFARFASARVSSFDGLVDRAGAVACESRLGYSSKIDCRGDVERSMIVEREVRYFGSLRRHKLNLYRLNYIMSILTSCVSRFGPTRCHPTAPLSRSCVRNCARRPVNSRERCGPQARRPGMRVVL